jgi:hypothetical protein
LEQIVVYREGENTEKEIAINLRDFALDLTDYLSQKIANGT